MSGHSKWSSIKHKKAAVDAKRGKIFTKLIREITIAAKLGGEDPEANPRLRSAVQSARSQNMPMDTVNRAISKGIGGGEGANYEEIIYEGFGPSSVAVVIQVLTDNRNRTVASIRSAFTKYNGNLGATNSVLHMFDRKGTISLPKASIDEDTLTELILDAGAEDLESGEEDYLIICSVEDFEAVKAALEAKGLEIKQAEMARLPHSKTIISDREDAEKVIGFLETLEEDDDVQKVFSNFDIDDAVLAELSRT
ncbi:MAG: YebC/PmpR family DNA-binding transcriptional regulator [SAR324 cluster bacterium]|nr:YebC/PmpR family DNA-binding transcriptional regulator [SAR324 cluster bacterium]